MKKQNDNNGKKSRAICAGSATLVGPKVTELISANAKGPFLFAWHKGKGPRVSTFYIHLIAALIDDFIARLSVDKLRNAWQGYAVGEVDVRIGTRDLEAASLQIKGLPEELRQRSIDLASAIAGSSITLTDYVESSFLLSELGRIAWFLSQKTPRKEDGSDTEMPASTEDENAASEPYPED